MSPHRPPGESGLLRVLGSYRFMAQKSNKEFNIPLEAFKTITSSDCFYCGSPPSKIKKMPKYALGSYLYNGIDRLDYLKGYTLDNIVPCCTRCNMMKWVLSREDFLNHIEKILTFQRTRDL
jgi:hypothetical protein